MLIYGAGRGGELLLREILNNRKLKLKPIGFIDDDMLKKGKKIHGYPILGTSQDLEAVYHNSPYRGILVSFSQPESSQIRALTDFCRAEGIFLKKFSIHLESLNPDIV